MKLKISKMCAVILLASTLGLSYTLDAQESETTAPTAMRDEAEFFSIVNETGGYITQALHQSFWEVIKTKYDKEQREKIAADIQNSLDTLKEFQIKTWESARESYFNKKREKVKEYEELKLKVLQLQSYYFSPETMVDNSEKMIQASADRSALDLGEGKYYITPELIEENMIGMRGSYERLKILFTPEWKEEYKEYSLPRMNVTLLSLYAPDEYHEVISHEDEKIDIHIVQLNTNENSVYEIGSVDYQKGDKKFADFTPEEKEIYIQEFLKEQFAGYRVASPLLNKGTWRGYEYVKGSFATQDHSMIILSLIIDDKAFYVKYVTGTNLSLASADFNEFTKRIQILEKRS